MATRFPGTGVDDNTTLPNPAANNNTNNPSHAGLHDNTNDAIKATQTKVGTGSSVAASNTLLVGTGAGTSSWSQLTSSQLAAILSDETGSGVAVFANTPTLITPKMDTISENTSGNGVTIDALNIKDGAINTSNAVPTAAVQDNAITAPKLAVGVPVQIVSTNYNALATGTTVIPADDTIPQNTEGDQYMAQTITPKSAANHLVIEACLVISNSAAVSDMIAALFQDAIANAIAATIQTFPTATYIQNILIRHDMVAGTASATTFKVRAGAGAAGTTTFNGQSGARRQGGITLSNIKITEYRA